MDLIVFLGAIFFGIVSLFTRNKEDEQPKRKPVQRPKQTMTPKPTPTPSGRTHHEQKREQPDSKLEPMVRVEERQRQERSSRLEDAIQLENLAAFDITKGNDLKKSGTLNRNKKKDLIKDSQSISVKNQLTQKRIVESLIMSEVLGSPRAHKPYAYDYKQKIK